MAKRRKSSRNTAKIHCNKTKTSPSKSKKGKSRAKQVKSPEKQIPLGDITPTSPFKGFDESEIKLTQDSEFSSPKFYKVLVGPEVTVTQEDKNAIFDRLLDSNYKSNFLNKNIKTYSNKKKVQPCETQILEFQDCRNRDNIIQWLNDNRNVFDRLTQTQCEYNSDNDDDNEMVASFDMPSVSQVHKSVQSKNMRKINRSPYKLRARSLDIKVKKNVQDGRNKRHSLAGDTPSMENYHIEEICSDEVVPAGRHAKILVDLMEDEYLSNIEKEILQQSKEDDKRNQSVSGWNRIKDINKTINFNSKKPKKLKITLESTQNHQKNDDEVLQNNFPTYNFQELENYFIEKMEELLGVKANESIKHSQQDQNKNYISDMIVEKAPVYSVADALETGNKLITILKNLSGGLDKNAEELDPFLSQLEEMTKFVKRNTRNNVAVQTLSTEIVNEEIQTDVKKIFDKEIQTDIEKIDVEIQTENYLNTNLMQQRTTTGSTTPSDLFVINEVQKIVNEEIQTDVKKIFDKEIQTDIEKIDIEIQTESYLNTNLMHQRTTTGSTTPSDLFVINEVQNQENLLRIQEQFNRIQSSESKNKNTEIVKNQRQSCDLEDVPIIIEEDNASDAFETKVERNENENQKNKYVLDDDLDDLNFDTEEALREYFNEAKSAEIEKKKCENGKNVKTAETVLVCSTVSLESRGKGVKRMVPPSPGNDPDRFTTKRPCHKFIREDLSVDFESCDQSLEDGRIQNEKSFRFSEGSGTNDQYLVQILKKYENGSEKDEPGRGITRTQEQIEEYERKIYEATKPRHSAGLNEQPNPLSIDSDNVFLDSENLNKLEQDINNFKRSLIIESEKTPKKVRKCLFSLQEAPYSSESMFVDDCNKIASNNHVIDLISQSDDVILEEINKENNVSFSNCENDKEVESIFSRPKINILQNIVIKSAVNKNDSDDDADVVESTPQKKVPSFSQRFEDRLDITLPPPLEFQDFTMKDAENNRTITENGCANPTPARRFAPTKVTSTPFSQRPDSEYMPSLSPIALTQNNRVLGPIELAQQSKFSPLTIIRKRQIQKVSPVNNNITKQKSILNYMRSSQESSQKSQNSQSIKNKPCIACTRISKEQVLAIYSLTNKKLATYTASFGPEVTHMIVSADKENRIQDHTMKFISAVAAGIWVLTFDWIRACLAKNSIVPEEPYEASDVSGIPGPRLSRLLRTTKPLFKGYKIHAASPFKSTTQKDIENVIQLMGGKTVSSPEALFEKGNYICIIIAEGKAISNHELFETWLEALKVVTVDVEWLSRSVAQYQILSVRPFVLCSEESIGGLDYPQELLVDVSYSLSQNTFTTK